MFALLQVEMVVFVKGRYLHVGKRRKQLPQNVARLLSKDYCPAPSQHLRGGLVDPTLDGKSAGSV